MLTTHLATQTCPICRRILDAASSIEGEARPESGDWTICAWCTAALVFDDDLNIRSPTPGEFEALEPEEQASIQNVQALITRMKNATLGMA